MIKKKKSGYQPPEYSKPTPPPPPTSGSNAFKPNPNYVPPASVKQVCVYSTPCGWCTKWEKKCDKRIGGGNDVEPRNKKNAALEYVKSGKGMPTDKEWF